MRPFLTLIGVFAFFLGLLMLLEAVSIAHHADNIMQQIFAMSMLCAGLLSFILYVLCVIAERRIASDVHGRSLLSGSLLKPLP